LSQAVKCTACVKLCPFDARTLIEHDRPEVRWGEPVKPLVIGDVHAGANVCLFTARCHVHAKGYAFVRRLCGHGKRGKDQNVLPRVFMDPRGPFQLDACFTQSGIGEHGATSTAQRPLNKRVLMGEQARVKLARLKARRLNPD